MKKKLSLLIFSMFIVTALFANPLISKSPEGAMVYFISPQDNDVVKKTFKVQFGLSGMGIAPAGSKVKKTGHHHLLINQDASKLSYTTPLPATETIKHFGGGQTETTITLPKGKHTLQLLMGNYIHIPHDKPVLSKKITIIVE